MFSIIYDWPSTTKIHRSAAIISGPKRCQLHLPVQLLVQSILKTILTIPLAKYWDVSCPIWQACRAQSYQKEICSLQFRFTVGYLLNFFFGRFWHAKMETLSKLLKARTPDWSWAGSEVVPTMLDDPLSKHSKLNDSLIRWSQTPQRGEKLCCRNGKSLLSIYLHFNLGLKSCTPKLIKSYFTVATLIVENNILRARIATNFRAGFFFSICKLWVQQSCMYSVSSRFV